jgi:hypothetical protein
MRSEIDAWMNALPLAADRPALAKSEREKLLRTIFELRSENEKLRNQLERAGKLAVEKKAFAFGAGTGEDARS